MREIKFKVWNRYSNRFIDKCFMDSSCGIAGFTDDTGFNACDEYELSQYTGIKDCKGREIYEGDIVKFYDIRYTKHFIGKVCFNTERGRWVIFPNIGQRRDLTAEKASKCEIIGNIHENKELLK